MVARIVFSSGMIGLRLLLVSLAGALRGPVSLRMACGDEYGSLQQSMERRGASFNDCRIMPCGTGSERSIVATAAHKKGSVLIRIPRELAVTPESALAYPSGSCAAEHKEELGTMDGDLLALWLLEQDEDSEFLKSLPSVDELQHLPVFWSAADATLLEHSDVGRGLKRRRERDAEFDEALRRRSPYYDGLCDRAKWAWAKTIVNSRAFTMPAEGAPLLPGAAVGEGDLDDSHEETSRSVLIPVADMLNHLSKADGTSCDWGVERLAGDAIGDFVVRARRDVDPGEISISYGTLSAAVSLLNYGFLSDSHDAASSCDAATLSVTLDDDAFPAKTKLWLRDEGRYDPNWKDRERRVRVGFADPSSGKTLLALLRVAVASKGEIDMLVELDAQNKRCAATLAQTPLTWRNERAAVALLDRLASAAVDGRACLGAQFLSRNVNERHAAMAAKVETDILQHWQTLAKRAAYVLDLADDADDAPGAFDVGMFYPDFLDRMLNSASCFPKYALPRKFSLATS